jgi:phospholipase C
VRKAVISASAAATFFAACSGTQMNRSLPATSGPQINDPSVRAMAKAGRIEHVVIIVQENRSVDNLFQFLPGADTQSWGLNSKNQHVRLAPESLTAPYDVQHNHLPAWETEYNRGAMNGFDRAPSSCTRKGQCPPQDERAYAYVPQADVQPYYTMAQEYAFGDEMFQTSEGPSFPAHQYVVSGTSTTYDGSSYRVAEDPGHQLGGCDSPPQTKVRLITGTGNEDRRIFPCFDRSSIFTLLDRAGIGWRYYQASTGAGLWHAVDALRPIWSNHTEYAANVIAPPSRVLNDIGKDDLASVVFVTPTAAESDHAGVTNGTGPAWVASVVNAIGESSYWDSTAIIVTWDDWGGWYDHVKPVVRNSYELGFRVPLIVISPYAKTGFVSHVPYEFGSILKFTETAFGLGSLGTTDAGANDLTACFNFHQTPRRFEPVSAREKAGYFLTQPLDPRDPDDD